MARLRDKCALIIGAGSVGEGWGNGRATSAVFLREGARVYGVDRDQASLDRTAEMCAEFGADFTGRTADINNTQEIDALVADCHSALGSIDILVNNVGGSAPGDVVSLDADIWERQFDHNINYVFHTMKRVRAARIRPHLQYRDNKQKTSIC